MGTLELMSPRRIIWAPVLPWTERRASVSGALMLREGVLLKDWNYYGLVASILISDINRLSIVSAVRQGCEPAILDKPRGLVLDSLLRQGKKVWCHVV
jgi:hypothetical protein